VVSFVRKNAPRRIECRGAKTAYLKQRLGHGIHQPFAGAEVRQVVFVLAVVIDARFEQFHFRPRSIAVVIRMSAQAELAVLAAQMI
jgi:hypothetical protein